MPYASSSEGAPHKEHGDNSSNGLPFEVSTKDEESRLLNSLAFEKNNLPPNTVPEELGITLKFIKYTESSISVIITNGSGFKIRYWDGYQITGKTWGYMGAAGDECFDLPSGASWDVTIHPIGEGGFQLGFGEYRLTLELAVDPDNPSNAKTYQLHVDFAIENTSIPHEAADISIETVFATPIGALVEISNGFHDGRIFYDKSYMIQRKESGSWQEVLVAGSDAFPNDIFNSIASRQVLKFYPVYWEWLYGELPPGEYRLVKAFFHRSDNGSISKHRLYAEFSLSGEPMPEAIEIEINGDVSNLANPFASACIFRAKVISQIDPYAQSVSLGQMGILVESLSAFWEGDDESAPFYIWDNLTVAVLDSNGGQILFSDIPPHAIVDITYDGMVLTSRPGHISGSFVIQIVE